VSNLAAVSACRNWPARGDTNNELRSQELRAVLVGLADLLDEEDL